MGEVRSMTEDGEERLGVFKGGEATVGEGAWCARPGCSSSGSTIKFRDSFEKP